MAERAADLKGQALAWHNLAVVSHLRHDYGSARTRYEEALRLLQLVGNRPSLARVTYNLGELYETLGALGRARAVIEAALEGTSRFVRTPEALPLADLGELCGELTRAT